MSADRIFISYRRDDAGGWARSLNDRIDERLGAGQAFRDVAMQGGMDFHEHVESLLDRCDVLLAIIGKRWATMADAAGHRRLDDPQDLVRREIARALERSDVQVIPVLVDGARMPSEAELPSDLQSLSRRQACELSDSRWEYDVNILIRRLEALLGSGRARRAKRLRRGAGAAAATVAAIAVSAGGIGLALTGLHPGGASAPATKEARLSNLTLDRAISFGQYLKRKDLPAKPYRAAELSRRGAYIAFDFRIEGYRGKPLPLRWQLMDARTGDQLDQSRDIRLVPGADTDQGSWDVWVPVPRARRWLFVQLQLYDDDGTVPIGRLRTRRFRAVAPAR